MHVTIPFPPPPRRCHHLCWSTEPKRLETATLDNDGFPKEWKLWNFKSTSGKPIPSFNSNNSVMINCAHWISLWQAYLAETHFVVYKVIQCLCIVRNCSIELKIPYLNFFKCLNLVFSFFLFCISGTPCFLPPYFQQQYQQSSAIPFSKPWPKAPSERLLQKGISSFVTLKYNAKHYDNQQPKYK